MWGTGYHMDCTITDRTSESVRHGFASVWIKHYTWPEMIVTEHGPEFTGHEFSTYAGEMYAYIMLFIRPP